MEPAKILWLLENNFVRSLVYKYMASQFEVTHPAQRRATLTKEETIVTILKSTSIKTRRHNYGPKSCKHQSPLSNLFETPNEGGAITNSAEQEKRVAEFELAIGPHYETIRRWAISKAGNVTLGEEVAQAAILRAFKSWHTYQDMGFGPLPWLKTIVYHTFLTLNMKESKQNKNRVTARADSDDDYQEERIYNSAIESELGASAESEVLSKMGYNEILEEINKIDPVFRSVALLNLVDGFKYGEIAELLGIPEATVGTKISRARAILSKALRDKAKDFGIDPDANKSKKKK